MQEAEPGPIPDLGIMCVPTKNRIVLMANEAAALILGESTHELRLIAADLRQKLAKRQRLDAQFCWMPLIVAGMNSVSDERLVQVGAVQPREQARPELIILFGRQVFVVDEELLQKNTTSEHDGRVQKGIADEKCVHNIGLGERRTPRVRCCAEDIRARTHEVTFRVL